MAEDSFPFFESSEDEDDDGDEMADVDIEPVLYQRRWLMLTLLTLLTINSIMHFIFYSAVARTVQRYFDVPLYEIEYLTISTMITTLVCIVPCVWVVYKTSLRTACLINANLNGIAALIKYFGSTSAHRGGYIATLIGQIISSIATCFIISMPAELAAVWFSSSQRSTATAIAFSGHFFGLCLGIVLSTSFVAGEMNTNGIEWGLKSGQIVQVTFSFLLLIAVYILFQTKPIVPPSKSQTKLDVCHLKPTYTESLGMLLRNLHFCLFAIGYGIIFASIYGFWQVVQEVLPKTFPHEEYEIGMLGAFCSIVAFPGIILTGVWLDKTKTYKFSIELVSFLTVVSCVTFTLLLKYSPSFVAICAVCSIFAFFATSFIAMGFVVASEMTYPVQETISSGVLYISTEIFAILLTVVASFIYEKLQDGVMSSVFLSIAVVFASIFVFVGRSEFKRYAQDESNNKL